MPLRLSWQTQKGGDSSSGDADTWWPVCLGLAQILHRVYRTLNTETHTPYSHTMQRIAAMHDAGGHTKTRDQESTPGCATDDII